jgi:hypothetical protein
MSLSRTAMTQDEATQLASIIDTSHLPVHVKRVTNENIVEVQDDTTGYVLPILSEQHWKQYARQQGDSNAIDEFANAGLTLLSKLDDILSQMKAEREALLVKAEAIDTQVTHYQSKRDAIEAAINAADAISLLATMKGVTVPPPTTQTTPTPHKRSPEGMLKQEWVFNRLNQSGHVRVSQLAEEMTTAYDMTKEEAIKSISSILSRGTKTHTSIKRVALGEYILAHESE